MSLSSAGMTVINYVDCTQGKLTRTDDSGLPTDLRSDIAQTVEKKT